MICAWCGKELVGRNVDHVHWREDKDFCDADCWLEYMEAPEKTIEVED